MLCTNWEQEKRLKERDWGRIKNSIKNRRLGCRKVVAPTEETVRSVIYERQQNYKISREPTAQKRTEKDPPRS